MPRPFKCRRVSGEFRIDYFKPRGVPLSSLEEGGRGRRRCRHGGNE